MGSRLILLIIMIGITFVQSVKGRENLKGTSDTKPITYLTWQGPSTHDNMSINVIDSSSLRQKIILLDKGLKRVLPMGSPLKLPGKIGYLSRLEINNLKPGTLYRFQLGSSQYKFRTLPKKGGILRFISGGDMDVSKAIYRLPSKAIENDLDFILLGGDLAYADGQIDNGHKWIQWFKYLEKVYKRQDGRLIPLISVIGNHEVNNLKGTYSIRAPFFSKFFTDKKFPTYFYKSLSDHSVLLGLDSGHFVFHENQKPFIEEILSRFVNRPNLLAVYHIPLRTNIKRKSSKEGQLYWQPLFDKYKLDVAFEHHAHTLKRSFLNKGGEKVQEDGVLYIGDGAWRDKARSLLKDPLIQVSSNRPHIWYIELSKGKLLGQAMAQDRIYDSFELDLLKRKIVTETIDLHRDD